MASSSMYPVISQKELYNVIADESSAFNFLIDRKIIPVNVNQCSNLRAGSECGGEMKITVRKNTPTWRCAKCQTFRSLRKFSPFFSSTDQLGRSGHDLKVSEALELVWMWCNQVPSGMAKKLSRRSSNCVTSWYEKCRRVCKTKFKKRGKMGGEGRTVQVDESLFKGRRKSNRGKLQKGDVNPKEVETDVSKHQRPRKTNYGNRVTGTFVFGLICKETKERRFFEVSKRDADTLIPIILKEVELETTIMSHDWKAYSTLGKKGYTHLVVNHSKNFVDPKSGAETQTIESTWRHVKVRCGIYAKGSDQLLESKLIEEWWRSTSPDGDYFIDFLEELKLQII